MKRSVESVTANFREFFDQAARPSEANRDQFDRYVTELLAVAQQEEGR